MYAIRRKKSQRWLSKVNNTVPSTSTKRLILGEIPILYEHSLLAHIAMVEEHLSDHAWEIVEVEIAPKISG